MNFFWLFVVIFIATAISKPSDASAPLETQTNLQLNNGKCLCKEDPTNLYVGQNNCTEGSLEQKWILIKSRADEKEAEIQIKNVKTGECLCGSGFGVNLGIVPCHETSDQKWKILRSDEDKSVFRLKSMYEHVGIRCISLSETVIAMELCDLTKPQQQLTEKWTKPEATATPKPSDAIATQETHLQFNNGKCLRKDVQTNHTVRPINCEERSLDQTWILINNRAYAEENDREIQIKNVKTGECLCKFRHEYAIGTCTCQDTSDRKWKIVRLPKDRLKFILKNMYEPGEPGQCMFLQETAIRIAPCDLTNPQQVLNGKWIKPKVIKST